MNLPHKNVADCFAIPSKKLIFVPEFQYNSNTEQHIVLAVSYTHLTLPTILLV